jgi:type II secretory pathway pseudopilin PulG
MVKKVVKVIIPILTVGNPRNNQFGFTYVMILVAIIAMGIISETASVYASRTTQMDREAELLFRGMAYRNAIKNYYESGKPVKIYPKSLKDLVRDSRTASYKSYIRKLYKDPMVNNGKGEWKLIPAIDGGISGVASGSNDVPIKTGNFRKEFEKFDNAKSYSTWIFEYSLVAASGVVPFQNQNPILPNSISN